jgi:serine/threonine protein kinase
MEILNEQTIKDYELKECLGEGAYGAVYRATQLQVGREVAVKIILAKYETSLYRMLETQI